MAWLRQLEFVKAFKEVYDAEGRCRGVIEVPQELSKQRALEGERRLLDW